MGWPLEYFVLAKESGTRRVCEVLSETMGCREIEQVFGV